MDHITSMFTAFNAYTHSNPVLAGVMSLWGLGFVTLVFRKIPAKVMKWIYGQITTTLELDNTELGWARDNYAGFMAWYMAQKQVNFTRHFSLLSTGQQVDDNVKLGKAAAVGVGSGTHYFFYKKRLCKMTRRMLEKQGRENNVFVITITMFSRNRKLVYELVDDFCHKIDLDKVRMFNFGNSGRYWSSTASIRRRDMKTVIASPVLKRNILNEIEIFKANRQWYYDRGIAYKKTFLLEGPPGGGKTSLIKAVATHFGMSIARLNLANMSDSMLEDALANVPDDAIVLIEDFDSADAVKTREALKKNLKLKQRDKEEKEDETSDTIPNTWGGKVIEMSAGLTLSGVLNALDGVTELDNVIIFLTTNVLQDIDPAVIRKGRVDHIFNVPALTHKEVVEYIELMFPNVIMGDFHVRFDDIMGCDLQALYFEHADSVYDFINAIPGEHGERLKLLKKQSEIAA
jgi:chaperone BCS1